MQINTTPKENKTLEKCVIQNILGIKTDISKLPPRLTVRGNNVKLEIPPQNYIDIISITHKNEFRFSEMWEHTVEASKAMILICLFGISGCITLLNQLSDYTYQKVAFPLSKLVKLRCMVNNKQNGMNEYYITDIIRELIITIDNFVNYPNPQTKQILDTLVKIKIQI